MRYLLICLMLLVSCSSNESQVHKLEKVKPADFKAALKGDAFKLVKDASVVTLKTVKNETVPVKATVNFVDGILNLKGQKPLVKLTIDFTSFDSELAARDANITNYFFTVQNEGMKTAEFVVNDIDPSALTGLQTSANFDRLPFKGEFRYNGKTVPVEGLLQSSVNKFGRIEVKTMEDLTLKIADLGLSDNLKKLMEVCAHKSVSDEVKFNVFVTFEPSK